MYKQEEVAALVTKFTDALNGHNTIAVYVALHMTMKGFLNTTPPAVAKAGDNKAISQALARTFIAHGRADEVSPEDRRVSTPMGDEYATHMDRWKAHKDILEFAINMKA
jgi:hypothetical protein